MEVERGEERIAAHLHLHPAFPSSCLCQCPDWPGWTRKSTADGGTLHCGRQAQPGDRAPDHDGRYAPRRLLFFHYSQLFLSCLHNSATSTRRVLIGYKCYLVYNSYEHYAGASRKCSERGGRLAMPRGRKEQEALADYTEGAYLYDDGTQVSYFQWRKHFLSGQPDGGRRENCVAMASDDGDWWDHYCDRAMNYLCEFDDRVAL
uniref:C-type lectin domain containing 11A n=1 Tax=Takifugu rubripes TaxID=31033 RepID=A0A674MKV6_TAKRU